MWQGFIRARKAKLCFYNLFYRNKWPKCFFLMETDPKSHILILLRSFEHLK